MKKRIFSFLLAAIMLVSLLPVTSLAAERGSLDNFKQVQTYTDGTFTDVKAADWFYKNIVSVYGLALMVGRGGGRFAPDDLMTVAEAMTIAARLHSIYYTGKAEFAKSELWYQVYADYCKANGIADPANYDLNKPITRGQFADMFANAFPASALKKINTVQHNAIPDVKTTDKFGAAIYLLYRAGVLVGNDAKGTFAPNSNIRRMEVAAITTRMADTSLRESIKLVKPSSGGGYIPYVPTYTVTFDMQGHGTQIDPITNVAPSSKITEPIAPAETGYTFGGWYKEAACTTAWNFETDTVTAATTLYAKWTAKETAIEEAVVEDGEIKAGGIGVDVTFGEDMEAATLSLEQKTALADKINDMLENPAVAAPYENKLQASVKLEETTGLDKIVAALKKASSDETAKGNLDSKASADFDLQIKVALSAANVKASDDLTVTSMEFDVTPIATTTVKDSSGKTVSVTADVSDCLTTEVAFRLPIDSSLNLPGNSIAVYHEGEFLGNYEIQGVAPNTYIEIHSKDFSKYSYQLLNENNAGAKIGTTLYFKFADAVAKVANNETVTLLKSATGSAAVGREVNFTVDKNGKNFNATVSAGTGYALYHSDTAQATITYKCFPVNTQFTITYKDQGDTAFSGTHGDSYPTKHTFGTATTLVAPTKSGYAFKGWYTTSACTGAAVTSLGAEDYAENITLYAKWVEAKSLGNIFTTVSDGFPTSNTADTIPDKAWRTEGGNKCYLFSDSLVFAPTSGDKETYPTAGKNAEKSGDNYVYVKDDVTITFIMTDNKLTSITVAGTENCNGTYTAPESTVTFDLNGAAGTAPDPQTVGYGEKATKPAADPTFANHTFGGWYKTKDATTGALSDPWDFESAVTENMTLYAKWTRNISTIVGTNTGIPTVDNFDWNNPATASIPENAWVTDDGKTAFWVPGDNGGFAILHTSQTESGPEAHVHGFDDAYDFTKVGDTYVLSTAQFTATCTMADGKFTSLTFTGIDLSGFGVMDTSIFDGTYAAPIEYMAWDETNNELVKKYVGGCIEVTDEITELAAGKVYVVKGENVQTGSLTVSGTGTATLILEDDAKLTVKGEENKAGIKVASENTLVINGQSAGTGVLDVTGGGNGAGIGGGSRESCGTVIINGGKVNATGGNNGAGIGGGAVGAGGTVTINGGTVTATGTGGAGIGGGYGGESAAVTINGGVVTANGGKNCAGIGGGAGKNGGNVTINGGTVTATGGEGGAGIGGGYNGTGGNVTINGGTITATAGSNARAIGGGSNKSSAHGTVNFKAGMDFIVKAGTDAAGATDTTASAYANDHSQAYASIQPTPLKYMDWDNTGKKLVEKSTTDYIKVTNSTTTLDAGKFYVVQDTDVQTGTLTVNGTAEKPTILVLADNAKLTATGETVASTPGIKVASDKALVITGQSGGTGTLIANGGYWGAGIGGGNGGDSGTVTINGGTVTATGGESGAGIGGGDEGGGGTVTINGGTVTATGGTDGAGIGGGCQGNSGIVTINGGTVNATGNSEGSNGAPGIGGFSDGGTVTINGGTVTATGSVCAAGIGGAFGGNGGTVTINGGSVTATGKEGGAGIGGGYGFDTGSNGGTVTINGGTVTATGSDGGAAIGGGKRYRGSSDPGTVTFGEGVNFSLRVGDSAANAAKMTMDAYKTNHSAAYMTAKVLTPVKYMAWDSSKKALVEETANDYIEVTNATTTLNADEIYVVKGEDVKTGTLTVNGTAEKPTTLILMDGAKLTVTGAANGAGINVASNNALVITGQSGGTGTLIANGGDYGAGIGGGNAGNGGTVTINGGTVNVTGGSHGAAIGGGYAGNGGTVMINGGTVNVTGGSCGAGIGGGEATSIGGTNGGTVTINGGTVTANSGNALAAGIGGGRLGAGANVTINGGCVTAIATVGAEAIGSGHKGYADSGTVTFGTDVDFAVMAGSDSENAEEMKQADYANDHSAKYVSIEVDTSVRYMAWDDAKKELVEKKAEEFIEVINTTAALNGGTFYVVKGTDIKTGPLTVNGTTANPTWLILADGAKLTADGINVEPGRAVVITGQSGGTGTLITNGTGNDAGIGGSGSVTINGGTITATGSGFTAGIGGYYESNGATVTINGGTVTATGGKSAAGIGGGFCGTNSSVMINGGTVIATGGEGGAGIGAGFSGDVATVTINGGTVTATGGKEAAGIGGGNNIDGGTVTINGGTVVANAGREAAGIGGGRSGNGGVVTISGGTVTANGGGGATNNRWNGVGAGIGCGAYGKKGGTVTITGGIVNANGGENAAGIGGSGQYGAGANVTITGGTVIAASGSGATSGGYDLNYAAIGGGQYAADGKYDMGTLTFGEGVNFTVKAGDAAPGSNTTAEAYAGNHGAKYVSIKAIVKEEVKYMTWDDTNKQLVERATTSYSEITATTTTLDAGKIYIVKGTVQTGSLTVNGTGVPTLILADDAQLTVTSGTESKAGINVASDKALIITTPKDGNGTLIVTGGDYAAGIGGDDGYDDASFAHCGAVTINGGAVTATGGTYGAGIGGGDFGNGGTVTINGGTVTATGGADSAGIGGGSEGNGGTVTINGGTVTATGNGGAGIGAGSGSSTHGTVTFGEGVTFTVKAGDAAPGSNTTAEAYAGNHGAKYVSIAVAPAIEYYLFGDITYWQAKDGYKFTESETEGEYVLTNVQLSGEMPEREIHPGTWDGSIRTFCPPDDGVGDNYKVSESGRYNIYFRPAGDGGEGWWKGVLRIEKINDN